MCQMSVVLEQNDSEELLLENVTSLDVDVPNIKVTTLFEGSKEIADAAIRKIDFTAGKVSLYKTA